MYRILGGGNAPTSLRAYYRLIFFDRSFDSKLDHFIDKSMPPNYSGTQTSYPLHLLTYKSTYETKTLSKNDPQRQKSSKRDLVEDLAGTVASARSNMAGRRRKQCRRMAGNAIMTARVSSMTPRRQTTHRSGALVGNSVR